MKKLILIDGNALVHRAFHALPPLTSPQGMMVNAVYGFVSVFFKAVKDLQPDYIAAAFDLAGPTFRHEEFEEYKSHRIKAPDELYAQLPLVKDFLKAMGVAIFEKQGFEADDLIGSVAEEAKKDKNLQTVILTGDMDTLQLVENGRVLVFTLRKGVTDTVLYDEKAVWERYGLAPEQIVDFKGLKGDPSDNIPGVPGVGDKTASLLLQQYGTLENLYRALGKKNNFKKGEILTEKLAAKLKEHKDQAFFSKKLATIVRDLDTGFSLEKTDWKNNCQKSEAEKMFVFLGFNSLLLRLKALLGPRENSQPFEEKKGGQQAKMSRPAGASIIEVKTQKELKGALSRLVSGRAVYVYDTEKEILLMEEEKEKEKNVFKIPAKFWNGLRDIFEDPRIFKKGHDLKNLAKRLLDRKIHLAGVGFDSMLAAYLIKPEWRDYSLGKVYFLEFNQVLGDDSLAKISALPPLERSLSSKIKDRELGKVLEDIELPLVPVLAEMEKNGIKVETKDLNNLSSRVKEEAAALEEKIYQLAGTEFNINSPQQLAEVLFERLQLKTKVRKTSGGALSTAAPELEKLRDENPIVDLILQYRELQKMKTTYIDPFPTLVDKKDGRLRTTYNQTGTVTGRLSSQNPNLQNIPIRTELGREFRKIFVAEEGFELLSFDYSQLELRIIAYFSHDQKMLEAFKRGEDIHTRTAAEVFGVKLEEVTPEMRREAKALNFGLIYGMGVSGFARSAGVSVTRAREFITKYLNEFKGVAEYMQSVKQQVRRDGFVKTFFGRRRELPEINSQMPQLAAQAERMAVNAPIQGTGADIVKLAMIKIYRYINQNFFDQERDRIRILLQVHDEILCEVGRELAGKITREFKDIMEGIWPAGIPLAVEVKKGKNWAEMEPANV